MGGRVRRRAMYDRLLESHNSLAQSTVYPITLFLFSFQLTARTVASSLALFPSLGVVGWD
jgi:hypothetical protein